MRALLLHLFLASLLPVPRHSLTCVEGPKGTYFGYAVAIHRENQTLSLLIGAPRSETAQQRYGVRRPGAVLLCHPSAPHGCRQVAFDRTGNNVDLGVAVDDKSDQWFGSTLTSSGSDGVIACAPRYVFHSSNSKRKEPVGTCFVAKNGFTDFSELSPCRTRLWGYHKEGFCQAGFSSAASGGSFFVGAVGTSYWQGQVFSKSSDGSLGRHWDSWSDTNDNQYLGYAVAVGVFFAPAAARKVNVVVSAPRAARLMGQVHILSAEGPEVLYSFSGEQIGSYFGHCLEVGDFNGDGHDDVIVGAPLFSSRGRFENGRAYLIFREVQGLFKHWRIIDGRGHRGRFGFAAAAIGDLNSDGVQDFALAAPYDGGNGNNDDDLQGKVFIFLGRRDTDAEYLPARVLTPAATAVKVRSFGFSLHGDKEESRLIIGAPLSDAAFVARCATGRIHLGDNAVNCR